MAGYDPGKVILTIGPYTIIGFHKGTFIKASRDEDTWKKEEGAQGDVVRTRNRNRGGKFVFTLQAVSPSNDDLSDLALSDEEDENPEPVRAQLKDLNGNTLWRSRDGWVLKPADAEYADEHTPREWTVDCGTLQWFNGGTIGG